ncbi:MAG: isochorismatase family protein [Rhodospirillales bacterium]
MPNSRSPQSTNETVISELPVVTEHYDISDINAGLVIVDEVNGFATVGAGPLAPAEPNEQVERMINETDRLAQRFADQHRAIAVFLDTHEPGKPEPPYPPHCETGTGQEDLVPPLKWLEDCPQATLLRKDCINGFVGAIDVVSNKNRFVAWVLENNLKTIIVTGICTDICVMDFVLTALSARNHGLLPGVSDIVVLEPACATYDLPLAKAKALGLPETAAHPQAIAHHAGLYFMASRGAIIGSEIISQN